MQKTYTIQEDEAYDLSSLSEHINSEVSFQVGMSSKGKQAFICYFENEEDTPQVDAAVASYDFSAVKVAREDKQKTVRADCQTIILVEYPIVIQNSMAMGVYPAEQCDAMVVWIAAMIEEENRVHDLLEVTTTIEEVEAINPTWQEAPNA